MAGLQLQSAICQIRRLATAQQAMAETDSSLLRSFLSENDQAAFTELVRRYAPMVLCVCRRVLHHTEDSEDAFQATFLLLARQANSIRKTESLASWLHGAAYRVAMQARRAGLRRRRYENRSSAIKSANPAWTAAWREVQSLLDEEIHGLPELYRRPFILCCLENRSCAEVAKQLGEKEGTVWSRIARARKRLQERLARRGVSLAAILGASAVSGNTAQSAAPAALLVATIRAVVSISAAGGVTPGLMSSSVAALLDGMNKTLFYARVKTAIVLVVTALGVGIAGIGLLTHGEASHQSAELVPQATQPVPPHEPTARPSPDSSRPRAFLQERGETVSVGGRVLEPSGQPFAGASLYLWVAHNFEKPVPAKVRATSGPDGGFQFEFTNRDVAAVEEPWVNAWARPWRHALIVAAAPGYGATWANIDQFEKGEATLRLVKDDIPVSGRIRDLQGRPVAGAVIQVKDIGDLYRPAWARLAGRATTDRDGRFTLKGIGRGRDAALRITAPAIELKYVGVNTKTAAGATIDVIAGPTKPIEGIVRTRDTGEPLSGALVYAKYADFNTIMDDPHGVRAVTDDKGWYQLVGLPKSDQYEVTVYPRSDQPYLSATRRVGGSEALKPISLDFALRRGIMVRFRLLDKETRRPLGGIAQYTLSKENPLWAEAVSPYSPGSILPPRVWFGGHFPDCNGFIQFVAYPGKGAIFATAGWGAHPYLRARLDPDDPGKGSYPLGKGDPNNGFLDIVNGYKVINTDKAGEVLTFDIEFTRGRTLNGTLVGPDRKSVTGATAYGTSFDASAVRPDVLHETPLASEVLKTAEFTARGLYPNEPRTLSFIHKDRKLIGRVMVRGIEPGPLMVRLEPWGVLTGRILDERNQLVVGVHLRLHYPSLPRPGFLPSDMDFRTDANGRFRVEGLIGGLKHELSLTGDPGKRVIAVSEPTLKDLAADAGQVRDVGDIRVQVTPAPNK